MSHIATIKTEIRDAIALRSACERLGLAPPSWRTERFYDGASVSGLGIQLPNWTYPVIVNCETGEVKCDNYHGNWGDQTELDKLVQAYAAEKARLEARKRGYTVDEQTMADGSIRLRIGVPES